MHIIMTYSCIGIFFLATLCVSAQNKADSLRESYGIVTHYTMLQHAADFGSLPGIPSCCGSYEGGKGTTVSGGIEYQKPISTSLLFTLRGIVLPLDGRLSHDEPTMVINRVRDTIVPGIFRQSLNASLISIGIEPALSMRVTKKLFLHTGFHAGIIAQKSFNQREEIVQPEGFVFQSTKASTQNVFSGDIPKAETFFIAAKIGVSYEIPLNIARSWIIEPQVMYERGLTSIVSDIHWNIHSLQTGVALKYSPLPPREIIRDTLFRYDTTKTIIRLGEPITKLVDQSITLDSTHDDFYIRYTTIISRRYNQEILKPVQLDISVSVKAVDTDGTELPSVQMKIEEFIGSSTNPILPYIFFEEQMAVIPTRFKMLTKEQTTAFSLEKLYNMNNQDVYYHILNIIGKRMQTNNTSKIVLVGCNAGVWENGDLGLSKARAEAIKMYLQSIWGIDDRRITIKTRSYPDIRSNPTLPDGQAENRRVEIYSDSKSILEPLVATDTLRNVTPTAVHIRPVAVSSEGLSQWKIKVLQNGRILQQFSGIDTLPKEVLWQPTDKKENAPKFDTPVSVEFEAIDNNNNKKTAQEGVNTQLITVQQKRNAIGKDKEIDTYNLVLFPYGKSEIGASNQPVIDFINQRLLPESKITIYGYTDRSGSDETNRKVAESRARSVAKALNRPDANIVGIGSSELLYDNTTPEGRQYCRTVQVVVETPK